MSRLFKHFFLSAGNLWILYLASLDQRSLSQDHSRDDLSRAHDKFYRLCLFICGSGQQWEVDRKEEEPCSPKSKKAVRYQRMTRMKFWLCTLPNQRAGQMQSPALLELPFQDQTRVLPSIFIQSKLLDQNVGGPELLSSERSFMHVGAYKGKMNMKKRSSKRKKINIKMKGNKRRGGRKEEQWEAEGMEEGGREEKEAGVRRK